MNEMDTRFANQFNIQWFPGHMTKTLRMMEQEIQHVDASLVLLDARIPLSSLNPEIERITARKPKLYALNKADLADPAVTEEWIRYFRAADAGCVAISAKQKGGTTAVIDARGRPVAWLPPYTRGELATTIQGTRGATPFIRFGNLTILIVALAALITARLLATRKRSR